MMVKVPVLPFVHAQRGEPGTAFIEYLNDVANGDRQLRQRQLAFIHEWDYLSDQLGHSPSPAEYAGRWNVPRSTVYKALEEFRGIFPGQLDPTALCQEIWAGVAAQQGEDPFFFVDMDRVRVNRVDDSDRSVVTTDPVAHLGSRTSL